MFDRVKELIAAAEDARRPHSYARGFEGLLAASAVAPKILADYERTLSLLEGDAWRALKESAVKRLIRNKKKSWEPLFDLLNEAKAHAYLGALGCTDIRMVPPSYDYKTPDLKAELNGGVVLCEVKTLNMSDDERTVRDGGPAYLSEKFLTGKLTWTLRAAKAQLDAFPSAAARKIVYLVFNPDESLHGHADDYAPQLKAFLTAFPLEGVEVEVFQFLAGAPA
ncbi:MAG: hypothetical protein IT566_13690 [Rhodospirillaceae bacterium]|nr:hypothetical protein [Rhodospirillaceae bacterium]